MNRSPGCTFEGVGVLYRGAGSQETVAEATVRSPRRGFYRIKVCNRIGEESEAVLEIRYRRMCLQTPKGTKKRYLCSAEVS
jgi:hypothetical protein